MQESQNILHSMFGIVHALKKDFILFLTDYDLTEMEAKFIFFIKSDTVSVSDLIQHFKKHKSTIRQKTKSLEDKGYISVTESSHDKRERLIQLTQKGVDWLKAIKKTKEVYYKNIFKKFNALEKEQLVTLLSKLEIHYEKNQKSC